MKTLGILAAWIFSGFIAVVACAQDKGTLNTSQPADQVTTAQAVAKVVKFAEEQKTADPEAYFVAAEMLSTVKQPVAKASLDGATAKDATFSSSANKPECYTVGTLLEKAKTNAGSDKELVAKVQQLQDAGKEEQFFPTTCFWGYCHLEYGCWAACW